MVDSSAGLAETVEVFDVFTGGSIPEGKRSVAFSVDFRATDRTLTGEEADELVARIVERLAADYGAEHRAG